jgi:hypothetical protein
MNTYSVHFSDGSTDMVQAKNIGQAMKKARRIYAMDVEKAMIVKDLDAPPRLDVCRPCELGEEKPTLGEPTKTNEPPAAPGDAKDQTEGSPVGS